MSVAIAIPGLRTVCELNSHEHWRNRQKRAKAQRNHVAIVLRRTVTGQMMLVAPLAVTLTRVAPSSGLDPGDNLPSSQKHVRDAVAELLGVDDRDPRVIWLYDQRRGPWAVEVKIEPKEQHHAE